jgi:hypothetical protein
MKIKYLIDDILIHEMISDAIPRSGDMIYLEEIFFVEDIVWYPKDTTVHIYLSDRQLTKPKVAESKESVVNLREVKEAQSTADKALKEATNLKRQVFSIRQFLRSQPRTQK